MRFGVMCGGFQKSSNDSFINILGVILVLIKTEKGEKCAKGKENCNK